MVFEATSKHLRDASEQLDAHNIQGNVLSPFPRVDHGCLVMVQCLDGRQLGSLLEAAAALDWPTTQHAGAQAHGAGVFANLGITYPALERAGLSQDELARFPKEFREGMRARAGLLGDIGPNHPDHWQELAINWPRWQSRTVPLSGVDVVITLQKSCAASDLDHVWGKDHPLYSEVERLDAELTCSAGPRPSIVRVEPLRRRPTDHFNLPRLASARTCSDDEDDTADPCALGERLLGYSDRRDKVADAIRDDSRAARLFKDGTFLVLRKLEQDVPYFEAYLKTAADKLGVEPDDVRALLSAPARVAEGADFRSNAEPRIVRRNIAYGSLFVHGSAHEASERGLMFCAFNANIAQQFEVVQRWVSGGTGTLDPPERQFVTLRWGVYLFVPSRAAIHHIIEATTRAG
jgi:hypothetical protein